MADKEKDLRTAEMFSALAAGLGTPGSIGSNLGQVGMQLTGERKQKLAQEKRSQEVADLIQQLVGGGGKATFDNKGFTLKAPTEALNMPRGESMLGAQDFSMDTIADAGVTVDAGTDTGLGVDEELIKSLSLGGNVNAPFTQGLAGKDIDFSGIDLSSLTAEDIFKAVDLKTDMETNEWNKLKDIATIQATKEKNAAGKVPGYIKDLAPVNAARFAKGLPLIDADTFYSMSKDNKAREWQKYQDTHSGEKMKSYEDWATEYDKRNRTTIDMGARTLDVEQAKHEAWFYDPETLPSVEKAITTKLDAEEKSLGAKKRLENQRNPNYAAERQAKIRDEVIKHFTLSAKAKFGESNIKRVVNDSGISVWYVKNPDGSATELQRY